MLRPIAAVVFAILSTSEETLTIQDFIQAHSSRLLSVTDLDVDMISFQTNQFIVFFSYALPWLILLHTIQIIDERNWRLLY
jgi:hypothetical protein